jgi:hypothetical protein
LELVFGEGRRSKLVFVATIVVGTTSPGFI